MEIKKELQKLLEFHESQCSAIKIILNGFEKEPDNKPFVLEKEKVKIERNSFKLYYDQIKDLQNQFNKVFGSDIFKKSRKREFVCVRLIFYKHCISKGFKSFHIAQTCGMNHVTIHHALKAENEISNYSEYAELYKVFKSNFQ